MANGTVPCLKIKLALGSILGSQFCLAFLQLHRFGMVYSILGGSVTAGFRLIMLSDSMKSLPRLKRSHKRVISVTATVLSLATGIGIVWLIHLLFYVSERNPFPLQLCEGYGSDFPLVMHYYYRMELSPSWLNHVIGRTIGLSLLIPILFEVLAYLRVFYLIRQHNMSIAKLLTAPEVKKRRKQSAISIG